MTTATLETLSARRLGEKLTDNEEALVRSFLPRSSGAWAGRDVAQAVCILAKTGEPEYRETLAEALRVTADPFVAQWALKGLVRFLGETGQHIPKLIELCRRAPFDPLGEAQLVAVQLAADVLAVEDSPLLMKVLIDIAEDVEASVILRQDAVASLSIGVERLLDVGEDMPETGAEILVLAREQIEPRLH